MTNETKSCQDRIASQLASTEETFRHFMNGECTTCGRDTSEPGETDCPDCQGDRDSRDQFFEYGLSFELAGGEECESCDGTGLAPCESCDVLVDDDPRDCPECCDGSGRADDPCPECDGGGRDPLFYRYLLSWGGPSDEIRFHEDGRITYHFMDWFDGAEVDVTGRDWAQWLLGDFIDLQMIHFNAG